MKYILLVTGIIAVTILLLLAVTAITGLVDRGQGDKYPIIGIALLIEGACILILGFAGIFQVVKWIIKGEF